MKLLLLILSGITLSIIWGMVSYIAFPFPFCVLPSFIGGGFLGGFWMLKLIIPEMERVAREQRNSRY